MKYNSIGEQLIAKAKELNPNYKPDKFNDMSEAIDIILNNSRGGGYKIKPLEITENGLYDSEFEAYKPVIVNIPPESTLKTLLDTTKSSANLFRDCKLTNVDDLIAYNDTANVEDFSYMFFESKITSMPRLNTGKAKTFMKCSNIHPLRLLILATHQK